MYRCSVRWKVKAVVAAVVVKGRNRRVHVADVAVLLPPLFEEDVVHVVGVSQTNDGRQQVEQPPPIGVFRRFEPFFYAHGVKRFRFLPALVFLVFRQDALHKHGLRIDEYPYERQEQEAHQRKIPNDLRDLDQVYASTGFLSFCRINGLSRQVCPIGRIRDQRGGHRAKAATAPKRMRIAAGIITPR